jgi:lipid-binding SYLF domain-containing protein
MLKRISLSVGIAAMLVGACATAPRTAEERAALAARADATVATMVSQDPTLRPVLDEAYGYAVFPEVASGGVVVGGAYGRGVVYERGQLVGFADVNQAGLGAKLGGQTFSQIIVFETPEAFRRLQREGEFRLGADASAVALQAGAARRAVFDQGVAVFVTPIGGLMVDLSVSGQWLNYQPRG